MALDSELPLLVTLARIKDRPLSDPERLLNQLRSPDSQRLGRMLVSGAKDGETAELTAKLHAILELAGVQR